MRKSHLILTSIAGGLLLASISTDTPMTPVGDEVVSIPPSAPRTIPMRSPNPNEVPPRKLAATVDTLLDSDPVLPPASPVANDRLVGVVDQAHGTIRVVKVPVEPEPTTSISSSTDTWLEYALEDDGTVIQTCYTRTISGERVVVSQVRVAPESTSPQGQVPLIRRS